MTFAAYAQQVGVRLRPIETYAQRVVDEATRRGDRIVMRGADRVMPPAEAREKAAQGVVMEVLI